MSDGLRITLGGQKRKDERKATDKGAKNKQNRNV
jgi:hypothetical protein